MTYFLNKCAEWLSLILWFVRWGLLLYCVLSWFVRPTNRFYQVLGRIFNPILAPLRQLQMRVLGGRLPIDLSPLLAYFAISLVQTLIVELLFMLARLFA